MKKEEWNAFLAFREDFKSQIENWSSLKEELSALAKKAYEEKKDTPFYPIENPVVYNTALDEITEESEIKLFVIGDNPGKNEQLSRNQKYLVGQAGKIGEGFFRRNPELEIDFRKNAIILNKTPVHTAKTSHIKYLMKNGSSQIKNLIIESQVWMAEKTAFLQKSMPSSEIWLVGYAELKEKGIFTEYKKALAHNADLSRLFVFQHFSMNCFTRDLKNYMTENPSLKMKEALQNLGTFHKNEIF